MKKIILLLAIALLSNSLVNAKNVWLNMDEIIITAQHIQTIAVHSYNDSEMLYSLLGMKDTLHIATPNRRQSEKYRCKMLNYMDYKGWNGMWPESGDTVLAVFDKNNVIVFARKTANYYRFWSPYIKPFTEDVFFINANSLFRALPGEKWGHQPQRFSLCSDGCLVDAGRIHER